MRKIIKLLFCVADVFILCIHFVCIESSSDRLSLNVSAEAIYNIKEYGATGSNVTDDSEAVAEAIDKAAADGGGTVYFPKGNYLVNHGFTLKSGISIKGSPGSVIRLNVSESESLFTAENAENISISGITVFGEEQASSVLTFSSVTNLKISDVTVNGTALISNGKLGDGILIQGNRLSGDGFLGSAAEIFDCSNVRINKNIIENYEFSVIMNNCEVQMNENCLSDGKIKVCELKDSQIKGNTISSGIALTNSTNCIVSSNNIVTDGISGITLHENNRNISITRNVIRNTESGTVLLKTDEDVKNRLISISQNSFSHEIGADGLASGDGVSYIELSDIEGLSMDNNYINNVSLSINNCSSTDIRGNMIYMENSLKDTVFTALQASLIGNNMIEGNGVRAIKEAVPYSVGIAVTVNSGTAAIQNNLISGFTQEFKLTSDIVSRLIIKNNSLQNGAIDCAGASPSSIVFSQNRNQSGEEIKLIQIATGVADGVRYVDTTTGETIGKIFKNGEWYSFDKIGIKARILVLTQSDDVVSASFEAGDLQAGNALIVAVYNSDNVLIKTAVVDVSENDASGVLRQSIQLDEPEKEYLVKAFVWSTISDMMPIYNFKSLKTVTTVSE